MGVTLARAAVKGGIWYTLEPQPVNVGKPINDRVRTFIGISGGNYEVQECAEPYFYDNFRICNKARILAGNSH